MSRTTARAIALVERRVRPGRRRGWQRRGPRPTGSGRRSPAARRPGGSTAARRDRLRVRRRRGVHRADRVARRAHGVRRVVRLRRPADERAVHRRGECIVQRQRPHPEDQLDRAQHRVLVVASRDDRAGAGPRTDHERRRAVGVDVIGAVLGIILDDEDRAWRTRSTNARSRRSSARARGRCRRSSPAASGPRASSRSCGRWAGSCS